MKVIALMFDVAVFALVTYVIMTTCFAVIDGAQSLRKIEEHVAVMAAESEVGPQP